MKEAMFKACCNCEIGFLCYISDENRCYKIEKAAAGFGIQVSPKKEDKTFKNVPFGVYMSLKKMVSNCWR